MEMAFDELKPNIADDKNTTASHFQASLRMHIYNNIRILHTSSRFPLSSLFLFYRHLPP